MIHLHTKEFPVISYRKWGHGPVIVLLHGFPENGDLWRNIWPALSNSFTVIVPDLPGTGESTFTDEEVSIAQLARSVHYIVEKEQCDKVTIAGHSMGGYVALAYALLFPFMIIGISLVHSTATADSEEKKENRKKAIELIRKGGRESFIKQMVPNLFSSHYLSTNHGDVEKQVERGMQLNADTMIAFYKAMMSREDSTSILSKMNVPLQWIFGAQDNVINYKLGLQQCHLSNVNFVSVYEQCGHLSMLEQPVKLFADLKNFAMFCNNQ